MAAIQKAQTNTDGVKGQTLQAAINHLNHAKVQCHFYQAECKQAVTDLSVMVLAFDYAQNVHYPSSAQPRASGYYKSACKLELFGVHNQGTG